MLQTRQRGLSNVVFHALQALVVPIVAIVVAAGAPAQGERGGQEGRQVGRPATPAQGTPPGVSSRPPVRLEPSNIDLGFLSPKTVGRAVFTLTNTSDEPLTILDISPSCRCTTVGDHVGKVLEPGKPYEIAVMLDGATIPQSRSAVVRVLFDGHTRTIDLAVRGEVANPVRTLPGWINVPSDAERPSGRLVVESIDETPFRICSLHGMPVRHVAGDGPDDEPRIRHVIEFDLADFGDGPLPGWLVVETDHPTFPVIDVRLRADARDFTIGIRGVRDFRIPMGRIAPGDAKETTVEFGNLRQIPTFVSAESLSEDATAELVGQEGDLERFVATIRVRPRDGHLGLLYIPVRLSTETQTQDVIVFATVNDGGCVAPTAKPADRKPSNDASAMPASDGVPREGTRSTGG